MLPVIDALRRVLQVARGDPARPVEAIRYIESRIAVEDAVAETFCPLDQILEAPADWDARLMALARHVAGWSKDPSTRVGAVLVGRDRREIALGYNGFPPGIADTTERLLDRPTKYRLTQHAERNVLDNARFDPAGGTLFVTRTPCVECAKSIISKGIVRVVSTYNADYDSRWAEDSVWTKRLFEETGVDFEETQT